MPTTPSTKTPKKVTGGSTSFIPGTTASQVVATKAKIPKPKGSLIGAVDANNPVEANSKWTFPTSITLVNEMSSRDSAITGFLNSLKDPITTTNWRVLGKDETQRAFIEDCLFNKNRWYSFLNSALFHLDYGFYAFEKIWQLIDGQWNIVGLEPRVPETIQEFIFDQTTWQVTGIRQTLGSGTSVDIPLEKLVVFVNKQKNDSPYGMSVLRPLYKDYVLKQQTEESKSIALSKNGLGIPVVKVPQNISPAEEAKTGTNLGRVADGHIKYFIEKGETSFRFQGVEGAIPDADSFLHYLKEGIYGSQSQNIFNMGSQTSGGYDVLMTAMFLRISSIAKYMSEVIENQVIKPMILVNFGPQVEYPKLSATVMFGKDPIALINSISQMIATGTLAPTQELVDFVGSLLELPEGSVKVGTGKVSNAPGNGDGNQNPDGTPVAGKPGDKSGKPVAGKPGVKPAVKPAIKPAPKPKG